MKENIVLTGFMATGKSTVGRLLAKRLSLKLVDIDSLIEERAGCAVKTIFATEGEPHFREVEKSVIADLCKGAFGIGLVVSTGGGAVIDPANRAALRGFATVVSLSAKPEAILGRAGTGDERPLLDCADPLGAVEALLKEREEFYRDADLCVDTTTKSLEEVVEEIVEFLDEKT